MPRIDFLPLDRRVASTATSTACPHHVARTPRGVLVAYSAARNAGYSAITNRIVLLSPDLSSRRVLLEVVGAAQPPWVGAAATGELLAVVSDFLTGIATLYVWDDVRVNLTPRSYAYASAGEGKFDAVFNEATRQVWFIGLSNVMRKFDIDTGAQATPTTLINDTANPAEYYRFHAPADGTIHLTWMTLTGQNVHYRGIQHAFTNGTNWYRPGSATPLALPIDSDETGASLALLGGAELTDNTFGCASHVDGASIHVAFARVPGFTTRFFLNLPAMSVPYRRFARSTGALASSLAQLPVASPNPALATASGGFAARGGALYFLAPDAVTGDVVALRSADGGATWAEHHRARPPGTVPSVQHARDVTVEASDGGTDVLGAVSVVGCTAYDFSAGKAPFDVPATVHAFRFTP